MDEQEKLKFLEAREKLKAKFGDSTRTGGKGTERRKKKVPPKAKNEDAVLNKKLSKFGLQVLPDIEEVNMFRDDDTVMHFKKPALQFSIREQLVTISGDCETKNIKDLLPGILNQVGHQQYQALQNIFGGAAASKAAADEDDVPELVGNFDDAK